VKLLPKPRVPLPLSTLAYLETQLKERRMQIPLEAAEKILAEADRLTLETRDAARAELAHIDYALAFLQHFVEQR
jgi:hypothetical protein